MKTRTGKIKWYRHDGTGYLTPDDQPGVSILLDRSVVHGDDSKLDKGVPVKFKSKDLMGREVATDVWISECIEEFDSFGLPVVTEQRYRPNGAEDARDHLEKARDEVRRSMDELRDVQSQYNANEKVSGEIKSALVSMIDVEKQLITAIHRIENVIHRVRKLQPNESKITLREDMEVEVPFDDPTFGRCVALFDVSGEMDRGDRGQMEWVGTPQVELLSITKSDNPTQVVDVHPNPTQLEKLEDEALEKYADHYRELLKA